MGAEEKAKAEAHQNGHTESAEVPAVPPPEEPPKLEEIITPEVLQAIIDGYDPTAKLVSYEAELGSKVGDNYMSIMYAVELKLETPKGPETLHVMLKTIPRNAFRAEMINEMMAFKKEATIYKEVFPMMLKAQEEKGIPKDHIFSAWPICYAAHLDGSTDFLAMQNLRISGFKMGNRAIGLDFNHCAGVLRILARYHAISYAKYGGDRAKIIKDFPILELGMFNKESKVAEMQQGFFSQSFVQQASQLRNMGDEEGAAKLEKISKVDLMDVLGKLTSTDIEHAVVTHGDCWVNNLLFKYDEKDEKATHPTEVKFIDFQIAMASSRLVDIFYFLLTSCQIDILNEREEDLLMIYYAEFTRNAQELGVNTKEKGLTWENFLKEAHKFRIYGVCLGLILAPMFAADAADIPDMDSFTKEDFEKSEETIDKFYNGIIKDSALKKVSTLVKIHLPRCQGIDALLA